ncbi:MAG: hypothetical protein AAFY71_12350 [Bacteroidota bacterium]
MKKTYTLFILLAVVPFWLLAQSMVKPEPQISFVKQSYPHTYYVKQAELWWEVLQKDMKNEDAWYNYYRACRSARGTANWKSDFVKESPALRLGEDIVDLMKEHIDGTFVYHFVKGSISGVSTEAQADLRKAYEMRQDFVPLLPNVITLAVSTHDDKLRKEVNQKWFTKNSFPEGLMNYSYNVLQSCKRDAILLTQGDNDTYPLWMLQDALGIRRDVHVLNIDFLLFDEFAEKEYKKLDIPPFVIQEPDINEYETNWKNVVRYLLKTYQGERPFQLAFTVEPQRYEGWEDSLKVHGLSWIRAEGEFLDNNIALYQDILHLDHLAYVFKPSPMQGRVDVMNMNYLTFLKKLFEYYREEGDEKELNKIKQLVNYIAEKAPKDRKEKVLKTFE